MSLWKELNTQLTTPKQDAWAYLALFVILAPLAVYLAIRGNPGMAIFSVSGLIGNWWAFRRNKAIKAAKQARQKEADTA